MKYTKNTILEALHSVELEYKATQSKLSIPIINRILIKMKNGIKFNEVKVFENLIIDGHHRYISSILIGVEIKTIQSIKTSATIEFEWNIVEFVETEWDTEDKIQYLNEIDAKYNNVSIEKIKEMID